MILVNLLFLLTLRRSRPALEELAALVLWMRLRLPPREGESPAALRVGLPDGAAATGPAALERIICALRETAGAGGPAEIEARLRDTLVSDARDRRSSESGATRSRTENGIRRRRLGVGPVDILLSYPLCALALATVLGYVACCTWSAMMPERLVPPLPDQSPVLYLRAFHDDAVTSSAEPRGQAGGFLPTDTEEEQLVGVLSEIDPVVAVGRPGERLPELGATREYIGEDWQQYVIQLMGRARLVVVRAGATPGVTWELSEAGTRVSPDRLVLLVPFDRKRYDRFCADLLPLLKWALPEYTPGKEQCGSLTGVVYFSGTGKGHFEGFRHPGLRLRLARPAQPCLKIAFRPVFEGLGVRWRALPVNPLAYVLAAGLVGLFVVCIGLALRN